MRNEKPYFTSRAELPKDVFNVWHKPDGAISPVAIISTVDADGQPRTAPFGSLRAITPKLLRFCSSHYHESYANLLRNGRVSVALVAPPDIAVSVRGRARVVKERLDFDENFAIFDVDIEIVKNDMVQRILIDSTITISAKEAYEPWYQAIMRELDKV